MLMFSDKKIKVIYLGILLLSTNCFAAENPMQLASDLENQIPIENNSLVSEVKTDEINPDNQSEIKYDIENNIVQNSNTYNIINNRALLLLTNGSEIINRYASEFNQAIVNESHRLTPYINSSIDSVMNLVPFQNVDGTEITGNFLNFTFNRYNVSLSYLMHLYFYIHNHQNLTQSTVVNRNLNFQSCLTSCGENLRNGCSLFATQSMQFIANKHLLAHVIGISLIVLGSWLCDTAKIWYTEEEGICCDYYYDDDYSNGKHHSHRHCYPYSCTEQVMHGDVVQYYSGMCMSILGATIIIGDWMMLCGCECGGSRLSHHSNHHSHHHHHNHRGMGSLVRLAL